MIATKIKLPKIAIGLYRNSYKKIKIGRKTYQNVTIQNKNIGRRKWELSVIDSAEKLIVLWSGESKKDVIAISYKRIMVCVDLLDTLPPRPKDDQNPPINQVFKRTMVKFWEKNILPTIIKTESDTINARERLKSWKKWKKQLFADGHIQAINVESWDLPLAFITNKNGFRWMPERKRFEHNHTYIRRGEFFISQSDWQITKTYKGLKLFNGFSSSKIMSAQQLYLRHKIPNFDSYVVIETSTPLAKLTIHQILKIAKSNKIQLQESIGTGSGKSNTIRQKELVVMNNSIRSITKHLERRKSNG